MVSVIIACFVIGYIMIVFEHPLRMDKTIPSLLMGMFCWTLIAVGKPLLPEIAGGAT